MSEKEKEIAVAFFMGFIFLAMAYIGRSCELQKACIKHNNCIEMNIN